MFLVDIEAGRIIEDDEIKDSLANAAPYGTWLKEGMVKLSELPSREHIVYPHKSVIRRQKAFGYTEEEIKIICNPDG
jgi:glutamate synthase (NADPH/NADH) large chain